VTTLSQPSSQTCGILWHSTLLTSVNGPILSKQRRQHIINLQLQDQIHNFHSALAAHWHHQYAGITAESWSRSSHTAARPGQPESYTSVKQLRPTFSPAINFDDCPRREPPAALHPPALQPLALPLNGYETYTMSQDSRGTVSTRGDTTTSSTRPCCIPTRTPCLGANKSTCARESAAYTCVRFIPCLLAVPTRHHSIFLATKKQRMRQRHTCTGSQELEVWTHSFIFFYFL
jgi:hypothetical protein